MKEKIMKGINYAKQIISANKSLCMKIIAVIIVIIAIIVIASCFKGTEYGNSTGNIQNAGLAAQDGSWIYYVAVDDDEPVGINRVKTNGKKIENVADGYMFCLSIVDNYIYCLEYDEDDDQGNVVKIKTNGKDKEVLARDVSAAPISVADNWVYYYKNDKLYRVKTDGTEREKISDKEITYFQIDGNWIYYIYENDDAEYIAKMKLNGEDSQRLAKADDSEYYGALHVKGGNIYYITTEYDEDYNSEHYLYKMNKKGEKLEKVCTLEEDIMDVNMQEDAIYYTVSEDYENYTIKSIKYNGKDETTIYEEEEEIEQINVVKDWIIYMAEDEDYDVIIKMVSKDGKEEQDL